MLDAQDEIAGRIVAAIAPQIREAKVRRVRRSGRAFSRRYDLALRALALSEEAWRGSDHKRLDQALALAREALASEPVPRGRPWAALAIRGSRSCVCAIVDRSRRRP